MILVRLLSPETESDMKDLDYRNSSTVCAIDVIHITVMAESTGGEERGGQLAEELTSSGWRTFDRCNVSGI